MKLLKSFGYAIKGILVVFKEQLNFKIHIAVLAAVVLAAIFFKIERWEWIAVLLCGGMVLVTELLNSAIEYLVDLISPDYHIQAGKVKDVAAGAVLIATAFSVLVGILIFGKYLVAIISVVEIWLHK